MICFHFTYEYFCENINLHIGGYFLITQQVSKVMMRQNYGNIINIGSIYGFSIPRFEIYEGTEMTTSVKYAAIKEAIINLTKYLASYLGKNNILMNGIAPSFCHKEKKLEKTLVAIEEH